MKTYYLCLLICAVTLVIQVFFLADAIVQNESEKDIPGQQRPPLPVNPDEECHIIDAVPLLMKKDYRSVGYKLTKLKSKPLIIEEFIRPSKSLDLKIEQRGCEDIYAKFSFAFKGKANQTVRFNLAGAAQTLKNLKTNSRALVSFKTIARIADIAAKESKKAEPLKRTVICLDKSESECLSDVSFKYERGNLQILYVDRP